MKLLLALAMRISAVNSTTFEDLAAKSRRRGDKKVIWTQPKWPVLCAFRNAATHDALDLGKPAKNWQLNQNLRFAAECAGLCDRISTQDIRRGSARDLAHIPTTEVPLGIANDLSVHEMGHTDDARRRGVTQAYVGARNDETWSKRLAADKVPDPFHDLNYASQPYKKRKLKPEEITANLVNVDNPSARERRNVATKIHKTNKEQWVADSLAQGTDSARSRTVSHFLAPEQDDAANIDHEFLALVDPALFPTDDGNIVDVQDLQLDRAVEGLHEALSGQGADGELIHNLIEFEENELSSSALQLPIDTAEFINYVARINIYKSAQVPKMMVQQAAKGGSRDKPSHFIMYCPNTAIGCTYKSYSITKINTHHLTCSDDPSKHVARQQTKWKCQSDDCDELFTSKYFVDQHTASAHGGEEKIWKKRPCEQVGCDPNVIYDKKSQLDKHRLLVHKGFPRLCGITNCSNERMYKSDAGLKHHLRKAHLLQGEALEAAMTFKKKETPQKDWLARKCPVQTCTHTTLFVTYHGLMAHIQKYHDTEEGIAVEKPHYIEDIVPQKCVVESCTHAASFVKFESMIAHMVIKHSMTRKTAKEHLTLHDIKKF